MSSKEKVEKLNSDKIGGLLFESAAEGFLVCDHSGTIRLCNPSILEMFGYTENELIGSNVDLLVPKMHRSGHKKHRDKYSQKPVKRAMGRGQNLSGEKKDGRIIPIEVSLNHFRQDDEDFVVAIITDITERKKMSDAIKAEKETAQRYLDIAGTVFVLVGKDESVELINKKGCELLGADKEDVIGTNWFDNYIPESHREEIRKMFHEIASGNGTQYSRYLNPVISKSGELAYISWNNIVLEDSEGNFYGTLSSGEDITQQKDAEEKLIALNSELEQRVEERTKALEESQNLYRSIARNFPNGVISILDQNLDYIFVEGSEMYESGISGDALVGSSFPKRLPSNIRESIVEKLTAALQGENVTFNMEVGHSIYLVNAVGLVATDDSIHSILMISQDISSLKKAEDDIKKSLEKERHLNELKSRFVSMASHEFRTPLTAMNNSLTLLGKYAEKNENGEKQIRHLDRIKNSIHHLTAILNDFLSLDKLTEGKIKVRSEEIEIHKFLDEVVEEVNGMCRAGQKIELTYEGKETIFIDVQMLRNICNNLLSNGIKYSPENTTIWIQVTAHSDELIIVVKDQGVGIPKEEQKNLFDRFFRANNVLNIEGTGLGLNIVKKYLDLINGRIDFKSTEGEGTTFTLHIPLYENR